MLQFSKVVRSRNKWKRKAGQRANDIRENRKVKKSYQEKITELKAQLSTLEQATEDKKNAGATYNL